MIKIVDLNLCLQAFFKAVKELGSVSEHGHYVLKVPPDGMSMALEIEAGFKRIRPMVNVVMDPTMESKEWAVILVDVSGVVKCCGI